MLAQVAIISHAITAVTYGFAALLLIASRAQHRYKVLLLGASVATTLWAAAVIAAQVANSHVVFLIELADLLEQARTVGWMAVVAFVMFVAYRKRMLPEVVFSLSLVTALSFAVVVGMALFAAWGGEITDGMLRAGYVARVLVTVAALFLVENLFRNSGSEARWAVKYLCFGVGSIFAFDFYIYAEAVLFAHPSENLVAARGIIDALAAPFIVVAATRSKSWPIDLHVSRRLVVHSATLMAAGVYLIGMAAVGYYLQVLQSPWGAVIQSSFLVAGVLVMAIVLSSGSMQARLKGFVAENFFTYKYDYRQEWLGFIRAISDNLTELTIPERIVRALANLVGSVGGAMWVHREEDDAYQLTALWNLGESLPGFAATDSLIMTLTQLQGVIHIHEREVDGKSQPDLMLPDWLAAHERIWLALPLIHDGALIGFVVLASPRAPKKLGWEDFELLKTVARQAASYTAEDNAARSLVRARRFEDFNRQFSFVIHDIKNLAGQMTLILKNAEKHGDNPAFQKDVLASVGDSVVRLRTMLEQLRAVRPAASPVARLDLVAVLHRTTNTFKLQIPTLEVQCPEMAIYVIGDEARLTAIFNHLIQNASDAAGPDGKVAVILTTGAKDIASPTRHWLSVTVQDNGPGMDQCFIAEKLFQPLDSTKTAGFGLGAYQVRQLVKELGGRLEVDSQIGVGTRMIVHLPVAPPMQDIE